MKLIAVSQRTTRIEGRNEKRDSLDQRLVAFLLACQVVPVPIANTREAREELWSRGLFEGLVLSGGANLVKYGGSDPECDETEFFLLKSAIAFGIPVFGICRGMEIIQDYYHVSLGKVSGHVHPHMTITVLGKRKEVNSFHDLGARTTSSELSVWAQADDGVIKAIRHSTLPLTGVMWHPERNDPFDRFDIELVKKIYGTEERR